MNIDVGMFILIGILTGWQLIPWKLRPWRFSNVSLKTLELWIAVDVKSNDHLTKINRDWSQLLFWLNYFQFLIFLKNGYCWLNTNTNKTLPFLKVLFKLIITVEWYFTSRMKLIHVHLYSHSEQLHILIGLSGESIRWHVERRRGGSTVPCSAIYIGSERLDGL